MKLYALRDSFINGNITWSERCMIHNVYPDTMGTRSARKCSAPGAFFLSVRGIRLPSAVDRFNCLTATASFVAAGL